MGCVAGMLALGAMTLLHELGLVQVWPERPPPGTGGNAGPLPRSLELITTASSLVLLGIGLLQLGRRPPLGAGWMNVFILMALSLALLVFNSLLHGALVSADAPKGLSSTGWGLQTTAVLLLLGIGSLCARPGQGLMLHITQNTLGGFLARRLVPVTLLGPLLFGVLLEVLHRFMFLGPLAKTPLLATTASLGGVGLVLLSTAVVARIDLERLGTTAALESSEARYRGLLETAPDPVVAVDRNGVLRFVNARVERVFGHAREELLGQSIAVLFPERLRNVYAQQLEEYMLSPGAHPAGQELSMYDQRKDGSELPLEVSLSLHETPEGLTVTAIIRDVTEREHNLTHLRSARAEAERERTLLQTVVDSAPVGILFVDAATDEVRANAALTAMVGQPVPLENGRKQYLGELLHPDGRAMSFEELPSTRALAGQSMPPEEFLLALSKGRQLPILVSAAPVCTESGRVRGAVVTIQDSTAHRELERLREDYVGLISHDLRNPLQVIALRTHMLQRMLEEKGLTREANLVKGLVQNAQRMTGMVEELLDNSRLDAGQVELRWQPTDLARFLDEVLERDIPPDSRERFRLEIAELGPPVPVDPPRLERVLVNLFTNALKYSPPGSPIFIRLERHEKLVEISVRDQGAGLRPEDATRLFQKYYRTGEGRKAQGVGLGLYISRLIVEAHGGNIRVTSRPGEGSTFTISLLSKTPAREDPPTKRGAA